MLLIVIVMSNVAMIVVAKIIIAICYRYHYSYYTFARLLRGQQYKACCKLLIAHHNISNVRRFEPYRVGDGGLDHRQQQTKHYIAPDEPFCKNTMLQSITCTVLQRVGGGYF